MAARAPSPKIPKAWRVATWAVLAAGLVAALAIWFAAGPDGLDSLDDPTGSKLYRHDLELYGGKANLLQDDFRRWFDGLWHGRSLAGTVAVLTLLTAGTVRLLGRIAGLPPLEPPGPGVAAEGAPCLHVVRPEGETPPSRDDTR